MSGYVGLEKNHVSTNARLSRTWTNHTSANVKLRSTGTNHTLAYVRLSRTRTNYTSAKTTSLVEQPTQDSSARLPDGENTNYPTLSCIGNVRIRYFSSKYISTNINIQKNNQLLKKTIFIISWFSIIYVIDSGRTISWRCYLLLL